MSYIRWQTVPEPRCCRSKCSVAKRALCATNDQCLSVSRMQSSDTGVGDQSAVISQVAQGVARQRHQVDTSNTKKKFCTIEIVNMIFVYYNVGVLSSRNATQVYLGEMLISRKQPPKNGIFSIFDLAATSTFDLKT